MQTYLCACFTRVDFFFPLAPGSPLLCGTAVLSVPPAWLLNPAALMAAVARYQVTHITAVPLLWSRWLPYCTPSGMHGAPCLTIAVVAACRCYSMPLLQRVVVTACRCCSVSLQHAVVAAYRCYSVSLQQAVVIMHLIIIISQSLRSVLREASCVLNTRAFVACPTTTLGGCHCVLCIWCTVVSRPANRSPHCTAVASLRVCITSGQPLQAELAARLLAALANKPVPPCTLLNLYGCTEAGGDSTAAEVVHAELHAVGGGGWVGVGRPLGGALVAVVPHDHARTWKSLSTRLCIKSWVTVCFYRVADVR